MKPYTILVITRLQSLPQQLQRYLDGDRFAVRQAPSAKQALALPLDPSLLILDTPPSGGGRSVGRLKGRYATPLVAVIQEGQATPEKADAAIARPFPTQQLADLVQSMLLPLMPHAIRAGQMSLDTGTRQLLIRGRLYRLRPLSCRIMAMLMDRAGETVHRNDLFQWVWETDDTDTTRALDVHIAYLRSQLEEDPGHPTLIVTEWGLGYRLEPPG